MTRSSSPCRHSQFCVIRRRPWRSRYARARLSAWLPVFCAGVLSATSVAGRQPQHFAVAELRPGQLALDALRGVEAQGAGQGLNFTAWHRLQLVQAGDQGEGVGTHRVEPAEAALGLV